MQDYPFLRIPPFPGARVGDFLCSGRRSVDVAALAERMRSLRVGGTFWACQPKLPAKYVLIGPGVQPDAALPNGEDLPVVRWDSEGLHLEGPTRIEVVRGECDPWHVIAGASALVGEFDRDLLLIAWLLRVPTYVVNPDDGGVSRAADECTNILQQLSETAFTNPFTGEVMDALAASELCGFWRQMIDSNRGIAGGFGFAFWKQAHIGALLWDGSAPFRFRRSADSIHCDDRVAVWRSKTPFPVLSQLEHSGCRIADVEDGFLRSRGLGANCIPPLSVVVDSLGAHFDPSQVSELELLLENGRFDDSLLARARDLRALIVGAGIGKYERSTTSVARPAGTRCHILVPGQVEDDRAILTGGCGLTSNLDLLKRVRAEAPDAYILYKPHPDVVAGHRRGAIANHACLQFADEIVDDLPIGSLIAMVDEVHVNSSLAGFEALLRGKAVTTHGVPFYAGWGLTTDCGPVPHRRTSKRTIDELVAAALLIYPRYIDPVSGLPCPAETVVARLSDSSEDRGDLLVSARRLQGKLMRGLRSLVQ